jgi:hypothetical protein
MIQSGLARRLSAETSGAEDSGKRVFERFTPSGAFSLDGSPSTLGETSMSRKISTTSALSITVSIAVGLVSNALSQRREIIFRQGHRHTWACRPTPEVAHHTADQTLAAAVDFDKRPLTPGAGVGSGLHLSALSFETCDRRFLSAPPSARPAACASLAGPRKPHQQAAESCCRYRASQPR